MRADPQEYGGREDEMDALELVQDEIAGAEHQVSMKIDTLKTQGETLIRRIQQINEMLSTPDLSVMSKAIHVNGIGELQSTASTYDALCGQLSAMGEQLQMLRFIERKIAESSEAVR